MLRGPGASVWVFTSTRRLAGTPGLVLVGLDGRPTGPVVTTTGLDVLGTDGTGRLLVRATGGTYLYAGADASGGTRVSTGDVLATSADRLLTVECDDGLRCARWLIDRRTGERTLVADDRPRAYATTVGSLSPDGTHAVVLRDDDLRRWELVSTTPGAPSITPILTLDPEQPATLSWSADGRYVVYLGSSRLWLLDTATGEDRPLVPPEAGLPDVYTFADRRAR
jgi:hypothetical protein